MKDSLGAIHTLAYEKRKNCYLNRYKANTEMPQETSTNSLPITENTNTPEILKHVKIPIVAYGKYLSIDGEIGWCSDFFSYSTDGTKYATAFDNSGSRYRMNPHFQVAKGIDFYSHSLRAFAEIRSDKNDTTLLINIPTNDRTVEEFGQSRYRKHCNRIIEQRPLYQSFLISTEKDVSQLKSVLPITQIHEQVIPTDYVGLSYSDMCKLEVEANIQDLPFSHYFPNLDSLKLIPYVFRQFTLPTQLPTTNLR
jgi:hypothetical protein